MVPNVTMNGTTRREAITAPFTKPQKQPVATASAIAAKGFHDFSLGSMRAVARTVAHRASAVPAERSMPPAMMINVIPSAATTMIAVGAAIVRALMAVKNRARSRVVTRSAMPKPATTSASARSGPKARRTARSSQDCDRPVCRSAGRIPSCSGGNSGADIGRPSVLELLGFQKLVDARIVQVLRRRHGLARVDPLANLLSLDVLVQRHDGLVTHLHRILQDNALYLVGGQAADQVRIGIEGD